MTHLIYRTIYVCYTSNAMLLFILCIQYNYFSKLAACLVKKKKQTQTSGMKGLVFFILLNQKQELRIHKMRTYLNTS